jgi:hypothetical protein
MDLLAVALDAGEQSVGLMLGAAIALYVAGRAAADATAGGRRASGGRLAVGHWLPVATVSVVAAMAGQFAVAVGIVFATAVGCLSLGLGTLAVVAPVAVAPPAAARRAWPLLVPTALLALLAGFHREVRWLDATAIATQGVCVLLLWIDRPPAGATPVDVPLVPGRVPTAIRPIQLALAIALAGVGTCLAIQGLDWAASASEAATPGLLTATFLAPLVVLPILGSAADLANRGPAAAGEAASSLVGVALLDACAGLPLVAAAAVGRSQLVSALSADPTLLGGWQGWHRWLGVAGPALAAGTAATTRPAVTLASTAVGEVSATVPFPLAVWRVDVVTLIALATALVPVALGRWPLSRGQGVALILAYVAYLFLVLRVGVANV